MTANFTLLRYKILAFPVTKLNQVKRSESSAVRIIQYAGLVNWKVGKSKLFLKYYHLDQLEAAMEKFYEDVVCIISFMKLDEIHSASQPLAISNAQVHFYFINCIFKDKVTWERLNLLLCVDW